MKNADFRLPAVPADFGSPWPLVWLSLLRLDQPSARLRQLEHKGVFQSCHSPKGSRLSSSRGEPSCTGQKGPFPPASGGRSQRKSAVITVLLEAGADPNAQDEDGLTPCIGRPITTKSGGHHRASGCRFSFFNTCPKADLHVRDEKRLTPLHLAAQYNENPAVITALLKAGADLHARDEHGLTPLHWAAWKNKNPVVIAALLDAGADPAAQTLGARFPRTTQEKRRAQGNRRLLAAA